MNSNARLLTSARKSPVEPSADLCPQPCPLPAVHRPPSSDSSFILFSLSVFLTLTPLVSLADLTDGDYTYTVTNNQATITGFNKAYSGELPITIALGGCPVTSIGDRAFNGCSSITGVAIPGCVTNIGIYAFMSCTGLTNSVVIPASVISIKTHPFRHCSKLISIMVDPENPAYSSSEDGVVFNKDKTRVVSCPDGKKGFYVIPDSVTNIGESAFEECIYLTNITIPYGVTVIARYAFLGCSALTSMVIPNSVPGLGGWTFRGCTSLTNVVIPASVTSLHAGPFLDCSGLISFMVDAANSVYSSEDGVLFNKAKSLLYTYPNGKAGSYMIPSTVTSIAGWAFRDCVRLTSAIIPNSVTNIGDSVFYRCSSLADVTIGSGVTTIGDSPFLSCSGLTTITVDAFNVVFSSRDGVLFNKSQTTLIQYPVGRTGNYKIPDIVRSIDDSAFSSCSGLNSIMIGSGVTNIGSSAFSSCSGLTRIFFAGNAPTNASSTAFSSTPATIYYLPGTSGWGSTFAGRPTLCWNPTVQNNVEFGFAADRFGFNVMGTTNIPVVVEATTNLSSGTWTPVTNTTLGTTGALYFSDPSSTNIPARYYRIVWP